MSTQVKTLIYAIKIESSITTGIQVSRIKIGQTMDIDSTLRQYQRTIPAAEILDLWEINPSIGRPEMGVHKLAEKYAFQRDRETFIFFTR
ncbi:MAG: hypothetical protein ABIK61_05560 [candidate division WOR-3 bacterium]